MRRFTLAWLATLAITLSVGTTPALAEVTEIDGSEDGTDDGVIAATLVITSNARLVRDVTCATVASPCIQFGASNIKLWLNGFTMTGPATPDLAVPNDGTFCNPNSGPPFADAIFSAGNTNVQILGPGMVQKFRRHGIFIGGQMGVGTNVKIRNVTSHHNCFSGILTNLMSDSLVEGNASVRNGINSGGIPCGGNCLVNSHNNRIRKNVFTGNGSVAGGNNDFGVGILFGSTGNLVEMNTIGGNTNGVLIHANSINNVIRSNVIVGNPPAQVSRTFGATIGADIKDESPAPGSGSRNTIEGNWCVTYIGPGPAPCPNFPGPGPSDNE